MRDNAILVGFDGSPESVDALVLARRIADPTGARVHLVMVLPEANLASEHGGRDVATAEFFRATLEVARPVMGNDFETHAIDGCSVGAGVTSVAERVSARMVVIGSSKWGPIGRVLLGDVGTTFTQGLGCELMGAPRGFAQSDEEAIRKIAIAYGGTTQCEVALRRGLELIRELGATGTLVGVVPYFQPGGRIGHTSRGFQRTVREDMQATLDRVAERSPVPLETRVEVGDVADGLTLASTDYDLVVVGSRGYGPLGRIMLGGTGLGLSRSSAAPVLIVPRGEA